jgi:hypothetical protein
MEKRMIQHILNNKNLQYVIYEIFEFLFSNDNSRNCLISAARGHDINLEMTFPIKYDFFVSSRYHVRNAMIILKKMDLIHNIASVNKETRFIIYFYKFFDTMLPVLPEIEERLKRLKKI